MLQALLVSSFSDWLVLPGAAGWDAPLGEVWDRPGLAQDQGRLIITYNTNAHTGKSSRETHVAHPKTKFLPRPTLYTSM